jgi:hypothetical protein
LIAAIAGHNQFKLKKNVHNVPNIVLSSIVHPSQSLLAVEIAKIKYMWKIIYHNNDLA